MFKKIIAFFLAMALSAAFAAVEANSATAVELSGIKGIGTAISNQILTERKQSNFKDWTDFITRVKGIGQANADKLSGQGLTVGGTAFKSQASGNKSQSNTAVSSSTKPAPALKAKVEEKVKAKSEVNAVVIKDVKADPAKPTASGSKK